MGSRFKKWFGVHEQPPPPSADELVKVRQAIGHAEMPVNVEQAAYQELERLELTNPDTAEYTIGLNYLDYLIKLPWSVRSEDNLDLKHAEQILNQNHFGLKGVKDRILEFLAVRILKARRKPHVLVADDEEITRENLRHILEKDDLDVVTAADGQEALEQLAHNDFDIILTDMKMGAVDGERVLEAAKHKNPDTQVIVISGYATVDSAVDMMRKGAFHYLSKPFTIDQVRQTIRQVMSSKLSGAALRGPILCFAGPPGTGKTSLAQAIAQALHRKFVRVSLAGVKDEAEMRGHRRTYAGAMPGRIIQEILRCGVNNPVFLLDEIDKAVQGFKGDPTAALLEILDPEQNRTFTDHYLELPFDLSGILFVTTANLVDTLPPALLDRMEILPFASYTDIEKADIARNYIIPKQIKENGLEDCPPTFNRESVLKIIREHTREAGLRGLERQISKVCRKVARDVLSSGSSENGFEITPDHVTHYLGPRRYFSETAETEDRIGVTTGMFWTENGGAIAFIEATIMSGRSNLILTGSLGEVMQESAQAALSYLRANAAMFDLEEGFFNEHDIHIHVPAAAVPKDGPSAGLTIAMALLSRLSNRPAKRNVALTGELTLSGRILPVAGIREKILAAARAGLDTIIVPTLNRVHLEELPPEALSDLNVCCVSSVDEAAAITLGEGGEKVD
jgi:ATP-dependent Lon protease